jgi:hypothetical protein
METVQVKVSVDPQTASAFKKACMDSNVSMAAELSRFMAGYAGSPVKQKAAPDYSTGRQRRQAIKAIINRLSCIKVCEEKVRDNMPENLQGSTVHDAAEEAVSSLEEAIDVLSDFWMVP